MNLERLDDIELMEKLRQGQAQAFDVLVHRYQQSLFNFFRRMGASLVEGEDMTQDVFLQLFSYRDRYKPLAKFTTFLYTLARHSWIDHRRKKARTEAHLEEIGDLPDDGFLSSEAQMDLRWALSMLPEKLRIVVVMNVYQELKYQEIADILNIPLGTVKSRMYLALRQLKEICSAEKL